MFSNPQWEMISACSFVDDPQCWLQCGGYCCGTNHPDFKFKLIPRDSASIIYFGDEYDWLKSQGLTPDPKVMTTREFNFDFGAPQPLRFMVVNCSLLGLCKDCFPKPLMCRLYPFVPIFETNGSLATLYPASIFDLTYMARRENTPCIVWQRRREEQLQFWRKDPVMDLLRHPRLMFVFAAYKCCADHYLDKFSALTALVKMEGAPFWQRWELMYLSKHLFNVPVVKEKIFFIYQEFSHIHGAFLDYS